MRDLPQADHCDLGLIPGSDHTEDLRPRRNESAPGRCANTAGGDSNHHHANEEL